MRAGREALFSLSSGWFYVQRSKEILNFRNSERAKTRIKLKSMFFSTVHPKSIRTGGILSADTLPNLVGVFGMAARIYRTLR